MLMPFRVAFSHHKTDMNLWIHSLKIGKSETSWKCLCVTTYNTTGTSISKQNTNCSAPYYLHLKQWLIVAETIKLWNQFILYLMCILLILLRSECVEKLSFRFYLINWLLQTLSRDYNLGCRPTLSNYVCNFVSIISFLLARFC